VAFTPVFFSALQGVNLARMPAKSVRLHFGWSTILCTITEVVTLA